MLSPRGVAVHPELSLVFTLNCSFKVKIAEEGVHTPRGVAVHPGLSSIYTELFLKV